MCGREISKSQVSALATKLDAEIVELEKKAPKVARLLEESGEEILGVYCLPEAHRKRMRTTNMLERQNQELKRRTRVVRVFPHEQSLLRLISALVMETSQQEWIGRIYLRMEEEPEAATKAVAEATQPTTTRTNYHEEWDSTELFGLD